MIKFSADVARLCPQVDFNVVETLLVTATAACVPVNRASDVSPVVKMPNNARDLFQVALRRTVELSTAFIHAFNAELFIPLFVLGRAALETAWLGGETWRRLNKAIADPDKAELKEFGGFLMNASLGVKSKKLAIFADACPMPNVLTVIGHLEKAGYAHLGEIYDLLCEYAHPNYLGMCDVYCSINEEACETRYIDHPMTKMIDRLPFAVKSVEVALAVSISAVEGYEEAIMRFTLLCEKDIHDRGTWPKDLEYPIRRED